MNGARTSKAILERVPAYIKYLRMLEKEQVKTVSSGRIAKALGLGEIQVRKDLAKISGTGKPKVGYVLDELIEKLTECVGSGKITNAILVGVGSMGKALLKFDGFKEYGINISAAFDVNESKIDTEHNVFPLTFMKNYCEMEQIRLGIITVPDSAAQTVCNQMVRCGITAILNFAPAKLSVEKGIIVRNENIASSLASLAGMSGI